MPATLSTTAEQVFAIARIVSALEMRSLQALVPPVMECMLHMMWRGDSIQKHFVA